MKAGFKSTEFYVVGIVVLVAVFMATGIVDPKIFDNIAGSLDVAGEKIPLVWAAILRLVEKLAPLAGATALAYSYLSNRTSAKRTEASKEVQISRAENSR